MGDLDEATHDLRRALGNSGISEIGPSRPPATVQRLSRFRSEADVNREALSPETRADHPLKSLDLSSGIS